MKDWMDGLPFIFSIILKLASSVPDRFYSNQLIRDIPEDYGLSADQKETISGQAIDGNERVVFIVTMLGSILSAAAICLKKQHPNVFIILLVLLVTSAALGIFWMNSYPLGYLEVRVTSRKIRRATFVTVGLVFLDLILGCLSVFLQSPPEPAKPKPETTSQLFFTAPCDYKNKTTDARKQQFVAFLNTSHGTSGCPPAASCAGHRAGS